jgi:hypothetical protein
MVSISPWWQQYCFVGPETARTNYGHWLNRWSVLLRHTMVHLYTCLLYVYLLYLMCICCILCVFVAHYVYLLYLMCICCTMCVLLLLLYMPDCWLEVSIRKVLRPATSTQVFLGFLVSTSECWDGFQVATTCLSCSRPDLNFLVTFFFHICVHVK